MLALLQVVLMRSGDVSADSVLTHEEIGDLPRADEIGQLILKRYPGVHEEQNKDAHAHV
jgi:hypothetical protein